MSERDPSPEYEAGYTTPIYHHITGNKIAGAAAMSYRDKLAGGRIQQDSNQQAYGFNVAVQQLTPMMESYEQRVHSNQAVIDLQQQLIKELKKQIANSNN
ncbi:hypothetical protein [Vibrio parahaemolyticus]|uniref:hypothetical protein n=1 Tax=Vibrio parahaemolyticus TaxID=670 RepID=UPI00111CDB2C|nr:hypothetical protein [Vibrio parahaemolyticus]EGQ8063383.1 hypothetical protein [Vibrio parahaemolyticus]EJB1785464.1 hypothetical protein [Vibrio parahaemolyticus]TOI59308.1 hypothetical protein CGI57_20575 [Vibrio parahaemolyticus]